MATINLLMFSDTTTNLASQPFDTNVTAEQPWVNTKFSLHDSDIEVRSVDGFIFQLHRVVLGVTTGVFPGSEIETDGEMVQLTEPAKVLGILFAFLYPKAHPDLHGEPFETVAAVAEAAGKYEVFSAASTCNERLLNFLPQHAPEILVHAVKHDYPRLISATLPHFARAPLIPVMEKLPPSYMVPWARYHEAWTLLFKELVLYIRNHPSISSSCHSSYTHNPRGGICTTCAASLNLLATHLEEIDSLQTLQDTLRSPKTKYLKSVLKCCQHNGNYDQSRGYEKSICPFVEDVTESCRDKIQKIPSFATLLGLKL
ncbi:uncharacterized protein LACBIDRAFT_293853 [Laccaria bicolor S238N-H82]|uniref:Predicted protein n=1 Tax=Laccaria bicolor (strain S238N-H82 / ATCC MYA-4686) TaxID=486041 RepID=B0D796_LACBS|nr:uncharacterized protein LACBIDRAFT_293853 [Laccaria bicolor S238N-H82]EDR09357.1 predicted protein [Laccaria bicolor S238N-H82]|eukprot:XP_001879706.1 predicted protein [Laccaria bicolor S238N-H82]